MTRTFLTSDLHLGHALVAHDRGFSTVDEHDTWIIDGWKATVKPKDNVIVVGDLAASNPERALAIIQDLPGIKDLVTGNHDRCNPGARGSRNWNARYMTAFRSVQQYLTLREEGRTFMVSHYPYSGDHTHADRYVEYRLRDEGHWLLHGHVHKSWKVNGRQINVGVDSWNKPVRLTALNKIVNEREARTSPSL